MLHKSKIYLNIKRSCKDKTGGKAPENNGFCRVIHSKEGKSMKEKRVKPLTRNGRTTKS